MVEHALVTRVRLTGTVTRMDGGPGGSQHCLQVGPRSAAGLEERWYLLGRGCRIRREGYHDLWPLALRPAPEDELDAALERLDGRLVSIQGILLSAPSEAPLVAVHKVQVAGLRGHGLGLNTLQVQQAAETRARP